MNASRNTGWRLYACNSCPHEEIRYDGPPTLCGGCGRACTFVDRGYVLLESPRELYVEAEVEA